MEENADELLAAEDEGDKEGELPRERGGVTVTSSERLDEATETGSALASAGETKDAVAEVAEPDAESRDSILASVAGSRFMLRRGCCL